MRFSTRLIVLALALALSGCPTDDDDDATLSGDDDDVTDDDDASDDDDTSDDDDDSTSDDDDSAPVDGDGDGSPADVDCDDADPSVYPGADEVCDDIDNDCDGATDEDATDATTWFADIDGDGSGGGVFTATGCGDPPDGYVTSDDDCDDLDAATYPGATEVCDGLDNDCDLTLPIDEQDVDGDGESPCTGDCDDADDETNTAADEVCDDADNDCDGVTDEDATDADTWYADIDGDGSGGPIFTATACFTPPTGYVASGDDCDDLDADTYPGAAELCDQLDNDCDTVVPATETDDDGDGQAECEGDCDDLDADNFTGNVELCDDADNDCDGNVGGDEVDDDGDGQTECDGDCDDLDAGNYAGNTEICDFADNDCDFSPSDDELDLDGDGISVCDGDCDDADLANFPGNPELCDGQDNDCDTFLSDEEIDDDGDGQTECDGDCDDDDADNYVANTEVCDGEDNDCDELADEDLYGTGPDCPGQSCLDLYDALGAPPDSTYWIDPDGNGALEVYCDMSTDGGGWTLVMKQAANHGYGSALSVGVWSGWNTPNQLMNEADATLADGNMVNAAYSALAVTDLRLTASTTWFDVASGAWTMTVDATPYDALSDANGNVIGNYGNTDTTPWAAASFTDETWTSTTTGSGLCWRAGPWFNQTSYEYTSGGIKWGWFFNNECHSSTTDTAEGLGCCGNSWWYRESPWTLYLWGR